MADRVVAITGASAGLGRAIADEFAKLGASVALLARDPECLEVAAESVKHNGGRPMVVSTDVARWEEVQRAAHSIEEELGPIDVWVNNAMSSIFAPAMWSWLRRHLPR